MLGLPGEPVPGELQELLHLGGDRGLRHVHRAEDGRGLDHPGGPVPALEGFDPPDQLVQRADGALRGRAIGEAAGLRDPLHGGQPLVHRGPVASLQRLPIGPERPLDFGRLRPRLGLRIRPQGDPDEAPRVEMGELLGHALDVIPAPAIERDVAHFPRL